MNSTIKTASKVAEELSQSYENSYAKKEGMQHTKSKIREFLKKKWERKGKRGLYIRNIFFLALQPNVAYGLHNNDVSRSHTTAHRSRYDSSGRMINSSQRPPPDNTTHTRD